MPIYKPLLLLFYFLSDEVLGLPLAFGSGRAVSQLAVRSALRAFSLRFKSPRSGLRPLLSIPQPAASPPLDAKWTKQRSPWQLVAKGFKLKSNCANYNFLRAASTIAKKSSASKDAPPTKAPLMLGWAKRAAALLGLQLPPYKIVVLWAKSSENCLAK
ncbi:hypothetical protein SapgrDRAFT_0662 [Saprospira grandis DSM 2844]|uniref:Uncharacterized protein n=1 Tax=Saprospira grandis DSM 2844 TaxID=694433 RepID=J1I153_9BACT|nr:hypothetical protein SapgrDRAFT_0662 [Saprospira grandis DSM 2844]